MYSITGSSTVVERDHGFCVLCWMEGQRQQGSEVHHIVPRSRCVGRWRHLREDRRNLALLCQTHHHPGPSRAENKALLRYLRDRHGYVYVERPFLEVLEEM